jgi:ABC-2 type transport system permease protein
MSATLRITRKELASFFNSPVAYVVLGMFLSVTGALYFFFSPLFIVNNATLRPFFSLMPLVFMFLAPAITMRLIAEERKSGTIESLLTLPVKEWEVVAGKYLAALVMVAIGMVFTITYPVSIAMLTAPGQSLDWGPVVGGYVGTMLLSSSFIAVGMWASSLGKDQIVGFIVGLTICFLLWLPDQIAIFVPEMLGNLMKSISANYHFENIARGVLDTRDVLYYVTVTVIGLIATTRTLASVRK